MAQWRDSSTKVGIKYGHVTQPECGEGRQSSVTSPVGFGNVKKISLAYIHGVSEGFSG